MFGNGEWCGKHPLSRGNNQATKRLVGSLGKMPKVVGTTLETKWRNPINLRKYKRDKGNHEQKKKKGKGGGVTIGRQRKKTPREKREKKLERKQENQVVRKRELWQK